MLLFCPLCGGLLLVSNRDDSSSFKCRTCAYNFPVPEGVAYASRVELKRKTVDDVLGGEDAWKNVDSTDGKSSGKRQSKVNLMNFYVFSHLPEM